MQSTLLVPVTPDHQSFFLDEIREASWTCIVFVSAAQVVAAGLFVWQPGVLSLAFTWMICIGIGVFAWARLRPFDLGLRLRGILPAVAYALVWLGLTEGVFSAVAFIRGFRAERPAFTANIGLVADQLLFFALSEEILFRGFLLAQLYRKLRKQFASVRLTLLAAILVSQSFFVLLHVPHRIYEHLPLADLPINLALTGAFGVLFCLVYLRTGNLLTALVVHAVSNVPALLPTPLSWRTKNVCLALSALLVAQLYAWLFRSSQTMTAIPKGV